MRRFVQNKKRAYNSGAAGTSLSFYEGKHRKTAYELCKATLLTAEHLGRLRRSDFGERSR